MYVCMHTQANPIWSILFKPMVSSEPPFPKSQDTQKTKLIHPGQPSYLPTSMLL